MKLNEVEGGFVSIRNLVGYSKDKEPWKEKSKDKKKKKDYSKERNRKRGNYEDG